MDKLYGASYVLHGAASGVNDTHPGSQWGTQDVTHSGFLGEGTKPQGVNNLVGTDRGGCNKYDIAGAGLVKSLSRPGGEAGSAPAPHICALAESLLPYRLHSTRNEALSQPTH
ncbi:unnamed protein product [Arctia plantaginis]|uniref:Uncharacterized protein n=1 Tax=Arctia plantaginis TaxID=874455 RepID=A0A8S0ZR01_ARCPL|nr:unnamed protein product [Arctia plantaginis]CAB3253429.1 unnamed protein product [Arctia plantaginis]